ncbi:MAG: hypothetical protein H7296_13515 [Bacteroidia bacterium]|nr:hypothetical protein [Bacteroidia bacterium]
MHILIPWLCKALSTPGLGVPLAMSLKAATMKGASLLGTIIGLFLSSRVLV